MAWLKRFRCDEQGTAIVTFVLVAPLFFFLTFGAFEGARIFHAYLVITNEAREAARYGAVNHGRTDVALPTLVRDYIYQRTNGVINQAGLNPPPSVIVTAGQQPHIDVTIYYRVNLIIPMIRAVVGNEFPVVAHSSMRGE